MSNPDTTVPDREKARTKGCTWRTFVLTFLALGVPCWGAYSYLRILNARVNRSESANNVRQLHIALGEFDEDYGRFPDVSTAAAVKSKTGTALEFRSGSANQLLCQLIANGLKLERPFFVSINGTHKVDDVSLPGKALEAGECGFSYIAGLSSRSSPEAPLLVTPLIPGTKRFDPKPFHGKALILRVDGAILFPKLNRAGQVMIGGKDLFDPSQPFWEGKTPDIKWHEPDSNFIR